MMQKLVLDVCKNVRQSALLSIADKALLNWDLEIYELQILIGIVVKLQIWLLIGFVSKLEQMHLPFEGAAINVKCKYSNANNLETGIQCHWTMGISTQV